MKNKTFRSLLDEIFKEERLKAIMGIILGNLGLPSNKASALSATVLFKEFILDGGYYPRGGMQNFSNQLMEYFKS